MNKRAVAFQLKVSIYNTIQYNTIQYNTIQYNTISLLTTPQGGFSGTMTNYIHNYVIYKYIIW